jgi:predicted CopG family antitoxin
MPFLTITISAEAHSRLKKYKRKGDSFTDVVLRELPASGPCETGREILDSLERDYPAKPKKARAA